MGLQKKSNGSWKEKITREISQMEKIVKRYEAQHTSDDTSDDDVLSDESILPRGKC